MKKPPILKTAMTPFPYSVERDAPLDQARKLMDEHSVHHLPVTHERAVVGIISAHDMQSVVHSVAQSGEAGEFHVKDLYVSDPYVVDLNTRLDEVLLTLADRHIGSAIVMKGGKLAGMFTLVDACRCFGAYLREQFPPPGDDDAA